MKRIAGVLCLMMLTLVPIAAFAQEPPVGHRVVIRKYDRLETDPVVYGGIVLRLNPDHRFPIEPIQLKGKGELVLVPADQVDPEVKAALGGGIYSLKFEDGRVGDGSGPLSDQLSWSSFHVSPREKISISIQDAHQQPVSGASIDVSFGPRTAFIGTYQTGAGGMIELPHPVGLYTKYQLRISDPRYGTCLEYAAQVNLFRSIVMRLPWITADDVLVERALLGRVLLPDGRPAAGAIITPKHLPGPEGGANCYPIVAGIDGRFRAYYPLCPEGYLALKGAEYTCSVVVPDEPLQPPVRFTWLAGKEADAMMESGDKVRRFVFEDQNGPIHDADRLRNIVAFCPYGNSLNVNDYGKGMRFLPGRYTARDTAKFITFEPVMIDADSPDVVTFRVGEKRVIEGRVVDATTSRPLTGAAITSVVDYAFSSVTRTDAQGRFRIEIDRGKKLHGLVAAHENYLTIGKINYDSEWADTRPLSNFRLFPSATLTISVSIKGNDRVRFEPKWKIDRSALSPESVAYLFPDTHDYYRFLDIDDFSFDSDQTSRTMAVPAGVALGFELSSYDTRWRAIRIPGEIRLAQGQRQDLGKFEAKRLAQLPVHVVDPDGKPIEGVVVFCESDAMVKRGERGLPNRTSSQGVVDFWIEPGRGKLSIRHWNRDTVKDVAGVLVPFDCAEEATSLPVHEIKLTAEQVAILRESMYPSVRKYEP